MHAAVHWDDTRIFLAVARCGTLSRAADELRMGIATLSRRLDRLESALGVPLFSRHQTGYRLTDEGEALLERAEAMEYAALAFGEAAQLQGKVAGLVRLATAENLANPLIVPSLGALFAQHPELRVEVVSSLQTVNLHRRDADLAIRMVRPEAGNLTIKRLGTLGFGLYGSAAYLASRQPDKENAAFEHDDFIGWAETHHHLPAAKWVLRTLRGRPCRLETNTLSAQLAAVVAGTGLAVLPHFLAQQAGLHCVLAELGVEQPIWLVMHADMAHSRRVRVVADHLIALFATQAEALKGVATAV